MKTDTEKRKARKRAYYLEHKEQFSEYKRKYYSEHKDEIRAYAKAYYQKNKDKLRAYAREYHAANKDECNKKQRAYYQKKKEHYKKTRHERYFRNTREGNQSRVNSAELDLKVETLLQNTETFGKSLASVMNEGRRICGDNRAKLICVRAALLLSAEFIDMFLKHTE